MEGGTALRAAYFNKIKALTFNSLAVVVFDEDSVINNPPSPYCQLSTQTEMQVLLDDRFVWDCTILVKTVGFGSLTVGKKPSEDLGELIKKAVIGIRSSPLTIDAAFNIITGTLLSDNTSNQDVKDKIYVTKLYRYHHYIEELN